MIHQAFFVPGKGLEPPRPCDHQILSLARLPFRHPGFKNGVRSNIFVFLLPNILLFDEAKIFLKNIFIIDFQEIATLRKFTHIDWENFIFIFENHLFN